MSAATDTCLKVSRLPDSKRTLRLNLTSRFADVAQEPPGCFGTFWAGEGIGIDWSLEDGMLLGLIGLYAAVAFGLVALFKRRPVKRLITAERLTQ